METPHLEEAMRRIGAGETAAFGPVYDAYLERIYRYVYFRIGHRPTAEDLTADIFVRALSAAGSFDAAKGSLTGWLYRIAHNTVVDHYRRERPTEDLEQVWGLSSDMDTADDTEGKLLDERLRRELSELTADQREVLLLRVWEGLPYSEIAELLGKSEGSCKMAFSRGVKALRQKFGPTALLLMLADLTSSLWVK